MYFPENNLSHFSCFQFVPGSQLDKYHPYTCHPGMLLSRTKSARSRFEQPMAGPQEYIHELRHVL